MASNPPSTPADAGQKAPPRNDPRDDAFIREVDEAYREDEFRKFMARWGRWILIGIGLFLAALGGWFWWQAEQTRKAEAISEQFTAALDKVENGATTEAVAELDAVAQAGNPSYRSLAAFTKAGIAMNGGDTEKAIAEVKKVAEDPKAAQVFRDAATLKLLRLEFDKIEPAEVLKRTAPFVEGDSPWFAVAGEMAALAHLKAGSPEKAGALFYRIAADMRTPASLRARAEQMAAALGQDVTKISEEQRAKAKAEAAEGDEADGADAAANSAEAAK